MKQETLELIHRFYIQAMQNSHNILEILDNLYNLLIEYDFKDEEDIEKFDSFVRRVDTSRKIRSKTFQMTNLSSDICFAMMYIIIWANMTQNLNVDISITARRKSLESELTKILSKDWDYDLFGIRGIILNNNSSSEKLYEVNKILIGILTKSNRKLVKDFSDWLIESADVEPFTRQRILYTIDLPLTDKIIKDYVSNPKDNGYQSLHTVLNMEMYSPVLPGAEIEFQLRNMSMHNTATNGNANHESYKSSYSDRWVFTLESFDNLSIVGFSGYGSIENDLDGIHFSKRLLSRRISNSLVLDLKY